MNQKQLLIFVPLLFAFVATAGVLVTRAQSTIHDELLAATTDDISSVQFYKDFLRDSSGLELPLTDPAQIGRFVEILHSLERTSTAVKSQTVLESVKLHFNLTTDNTKNLGIKAYRTAELGDRALVTVSRIRGAGVTSGGTYTSDTFLGWLEKISTAPEFSEIWEIGK